MTQDKTKKHVDKCYNCSSPTDLFEMDLQKQKKVMFCRGCGLFHYYKRDFFGNWELRKVSKTPEITYDK